MEKLFIEPTILEGIDWTDKVMLEEIFGPILPILEYDNLSLLTLVCIRIILLLTSSVLIWEYNNDLFLVFQNLEANVSEKMNKKKENRINSYNYQKSRINKIGIENIKQSKLNRLEKEQAKWLKEFQANQKVIPDLKHLLTVRIDAK